MFNNKNTAAIIFCLMLLNKSLLAQTKIAFVMPFCSKQINEKANNKNAELGNACREYYQGAMLCTDSLLAENLSINIAVFDTEKDSNTFIKICKKKEIADADIIIGPVTKEAQLTIKYYATTKQKSHVSPLFTFTKTKINDPYIICANPDLSYYADYLLDYISIENNLPNIIIIQDNDASDKVFGNRVKQLLKIYNNAKISFVDISKLDEIYKYLSPTKSNHVVLSSSDESKVNRTLNTLNDTTGLYNITTYGFTQWLNFSAINGKLWEQCKVHIITPQFVNYSDKNTQIFIERYRKKYYTEPSIFAFQGFDQFMFFAKNAMLIKTDIKKVAQQNKFIGLCNNIKIDNKPDSEGLQNEILNILKWQNMKFEKVAY